MADPTCCREGLASLAPWTQELEAGLDAAENQSLPPHLRAPSTETWPLRVGRYSRGRGAVALFSIGLVIAITGWLADISFAAFAGGGAMASSRWLQPWHMSHLLRSRSARNVRLFASSRPARPSQPTPGMGRLLRPRQPILSRRMQSAEPATADFSTVTEAPPFEGEWAFRASVLGCAGALSGHIFLDPSGRAVYVGDGVQAIGRGVGNWVVDPFGAAAIELDVYQYAAAAAVIPEKPHRFRGLWPLGGSRSLQGDWYVVPEGEAPRLVGSFDAATNTQELLPAVVENSNRPMRDRQLSEAATAGLMEALDAAPSITGPAASIDERLEPFRIGNVPSMYYIPGWCDVAQEKAFTHHADVELNGWENMRTRSSQEWGAGDRCKCGRGLMREPLPPVQQQIADALHHLGIFDGALYPMNSVRINGYVPGQGIHPHCDGPVYYPKVAILSLNSPCVFNFHPRSGTEDCMKWDPENDVPGGHVGAGPEVSVLLEPRSLLVFGQDAFWHHRHGIEAVPSDIITDKVCNLEALLDRSYKVGDRIDRTRRVSLTMRHLLPRCACQG